MQVGFGTWVILCWPLVWNMTTWLYVCSSMKIIWMKESSSSVWEARTSEAGVNHPFLIQILGWPVHPLVSCQGQFIVMNASYLYLVRAKEDGEWESSVREEIRKRFLHKEGPRRTEGTGAGGVGYALTLPSWWVRLCGKTLGSNFSHSGLKCFRR